jgi:hypothetical protein
MQQSHATDQRGGRALVSALGAEFAYLLALVRVVDKQLAMGRVTAACRLMRQ